MSFLETRSRFPETLCVCGHRAGIHLYCSEHCCVQTGCCCKAFAATEEENLQELADGLTVVPRKQPKSGVGPMRSRKNDPAKRRPTRKAA